MNNNLYLDMHVIQTLPPSNINRDDTGSPKTCQYGGVTRARVSSQSWKKAMRDYFKDNSETNNVGTRSLEVVKYLAEKIQDKKDISKEEALKLSNEIFNTAKVKTSDDKVKALFFLGNRQAEKLADAAINSFDNNEKLEKNLIENIFNTNPAIDIALFGRMVADNPALNEDASAQVAHSISTHAVATEYDFFTAVDDIIKEDNAGAGMLGTIEFNSSTLYRYANVAIHELNKQLNEDREALTNTINLFIKAFVMSLPTGKVTTFANQTLPEALIINLREDRPVNMVTAFENPVKANENGYVKKSTEALFNEFEKTEKFVKKPLASYYIILNEIKIDNNLGEAWKEEKNLSDLLEDLQEKIEEFNF